MAHNPNGPTPIGQIFSELALHSPGGRELLAHAHGFDESRRLGVATKVADVAVRVAREDAVSLGETRAEGHVVDATELAAIRATLLAATADQRRLMQDKE